MAGLYNITTQEQIQDILSRPAGTPPAGVALNQESPPNLDLPVVLTVVLCISLGALTTLARIYTKVFLIKSVALEDCMLAACSTEGCVR